jgi:pyridoxal phosphate enzyme (YggS family)
MGTIAANLQAARERIARAAAAAGRSADDIALVAVSKTFAAAMVVEAFGCGQRTFGENQTQEGVKKIAELVHLDIIWHFIGPIQSNKTRTIAEHFQWVHGIERERIAERLNDARPAALPPLEVCIQVNVSGEASKAGVAPGGEAALAEAISRLPRLRLRGLMAIPEPTTDTASRRRQFALLRALKDGLGARGYALDTLSMGMSDDLEEAILEGSTMVRVGTAIFGQRHKG